MTISSDSKHLEILVQLPQALAEITLSDVLQLDNNNNATNTLSTFHIAVHHKNLYPREEALKKIKQDWILFFIFHFSLSPPRPRQEVSLGLETPIISSNFCTF